MASVLTSYDLVGYISTYQSSVGVAHCPLLTTFERIGANPFKSSHLRIQLSFSARLPRCKGGLEALHLPGAAEVRQQAARPTCAWPDKYPPKQWELWWTCRYRLPTLHFSHNLLTSFSTNNFLGHETETSAKRNDERTYEIKCAACGRLGSSRNVLRP